MPFSRVNVVLRSRQRSRIVGTAGAAARRGPSNWQTPHGGYYRVWEEAGNIWAGFSSLSRPAFLHRAQVSTGGSGSEPRVSVDAVGTVVVSFTRTVGASTNVMLTTSFDDGLTWSTPVVAITQASHGHVTHGADGTRYVAGYKSGKISLTRRALGDTAASAEAFIKDTAGADLLVADDQFSIHEAASPDAPLVLAVRINGEADISEWLSWDQGQSFKRVT